MRASAFAIAALALLSSSATAQSFPARSGETGILDVPDAEVTGLGGGQLGVEFAFDRARGRPTDLGPLPVYAVAGVAERLDLGLTMRERGQPGDAAPSRVLFGAAAKLQLWSPNGPVPGAALSAVFDRVNRAAVAGARLAVSTGRIPVRFAAFGGAEAPANEPGELDATAGIAASVPFRRGFELVGEGVLGPRGNNVGLALRWAATPTIAISLGGNYFAKEEGFRAALAVGIVPVARRKIVTPVTEKREEPGPEVAVAAGPTFLDDRPHFRLRIHLSGPESLGQPRRQQQGPWTAPAALAAAAAQPAAVRAAAPSIDDLAEAQLKEQETLADTRERRVRATSDHLDTREKAAQDEAKRLEDRERELAGREQQLAAREQRIAIRGAPTQQQRQLESLEAQLASQERQLSAQERSYGPAIDAAQGRERDAAARESAERQEATRLAASVIAAGGSRAQQLEIRKQALAARNRQLAALEARLVAKGERIDSLERQLRLKTERLDAWSRRLDTRGERLDLLEKRATESRTPPTAPKPAGAVQPPKDKAVFVMVVKSPTAIMKERSTTAPAPPAAAALHPGVAVEKAVAAATVVTFPTPATVLSELDRETIDNIAKLAAKDNCELLIWARAKDPGLMAEAQRRAAEIKARVVAAGPLAEKQVVTRITTRPGANGVDVVVSALRETAKPAQPAAAPQAPAAAAPTLAAGESGKRQIREAVQSAQSTIEACVGEHIEAKRLQRAEGVLKLTVSSQGAVTKVATGGGDLAGTRIEECLGRASAGWAFPAADADYVVDVPITVIRGGTGQ